MRKSISFIVLCFLFSIHPAFAAPVEPDLSSVADGVQSLYKSIATLSFDFVQETKLALLDKVVEKHGQMWFARPGKFFIHYTTPPLKEYICNGTRLWILVPDEKKVYQTAIKKDELDEQAKLFLDGLGNLKGSFLVSPLPDKQRKAAMFAPQSGRVVMQLIPKQDSSFFTWIAIAVDPATYRVEEMTLFNKSENVSHYAFSNFAINPSIVEEKFTWKKDPNVRVEKE